MTSSLFLINGIRQMKNKTSTIKTNTINNTNKTNTINKNSNTLLRTNNDES